MTPTARSKRVCVCADDFGLNEAGSCAIVQLASMGAISAASCVVDGVYAGRYAGELVGSGAGTSLGLHLNLTVANGPTVRHDLLTWVGRSVVLRSVNRIALVREVERQLDAFVVLFGRAPCFVDGHEHVHQFPIVRDAVLEVLKARFDAQVAVRSTMPRVWRGVKAQVIAELGGRAMRRRLRQHNLHANADFAGVYGFGNRVDYAERMQSWLRSIAHDGLIMCHPELPAADRDGNDARASEYQFLASADWPRLLAAEHVDLAPFSGATARSALLNT